MTTRTTTMRTLIAACALAGLTTGAFAQTTTARDTRLADAASRNDLAAVRRLIADKADVNGAQGDGMTALFEPIGEATDVGRAAGGVGAFDDDEPAFEPGELDAGTWVAVAALGAHRPILRRKRARATAPSMCLRISACCWWMGVEASMPTKR